MLVTVRHAYGRAVAVTGMVWSGRGIAMNEFYVLFKIDNAAFEEDGRNSEIARILRAVADQVEDDVTGGNVRDINGNSVGDFGIKLD